ncbi:hypothetical protein CVS40_2087 [Lucilia cuprina]|nr:hypothetical protein CVS40_2087 [Lucilia cuprina]
MSFSLLRRPQEIPWICSVNLNEECGKMRCCIALMILSEFAAAAPPNRKSLIKNKVKRADETTQVAGWLASILIFIPYGYA